MDMNFILGNWLNIQVYIDDPLDPFVNQYMKNDVISYDITCASMLYQCLLTPISFLGFLALYFCNIHVFQNDIKLTRFENLNLVLHVARHLKVVTSWKN